MPRLTTDPRTAELRVLLSPLLKRRAAALAARQGTSLSTLAVEALEAYLARQEENPLLAFAGIWQDEADDLARSIRDARHNAGRVPDW